MSVVIVGASLAGVRTAESLRRRGYAEPIVILGRETEPPYDRPQLSKGYLAATPPELEALSSPTSYGEMKIELRLGVTASGVDLARREVMTVEHGTFPYGDLVIATGAHPRHGPDRRGLSGFHVVRTLADARALRTDLETGSRLAVIGGGFIGAEVAAAARKRGLEVTIIEALPAPLSRGLGAEVGSLLAAMHAENGVRLRCGVAVSGVRGTKRVEALTLTDGSEVPCDVVVVGIGVEPTTGWLARSGLDLDDGVLCDADLRAVGTTNVFAVGDVARWPNAKLGETLRIEHWTNACEHADIVAAALTGGERPDPAIPYVWSDQYGRRIQIVGRPRSDDHVVIRRDDVAGKHVAAYERGGRLVGLMSVDLPRASSKARRAIGAGQISAADFLATV